jgi:hypothetical protein
LQPGGGEGDKVFPPTFAGAGYSAEGRGVSYATDAEMATALADLERRIAAAQCGRVRQVRIRSTKGV